VRVLVSGASGFVGGFLVDALLAEGHEVVGLTRDVARARDYSPKLEWRTLQDLPDEADAVVNLAGSTVARLWTPGAKREILQSRIETTKRLVEWALHAKNPPQVFLSSSAVGIYGHRPGETLDEDSPLDPLKSYRYRVCAAWEEAAQDVQKAGIRLVLLRFANVLHPSGGYLGAMMKAARLIPTTLGDPARGFSWIEAEDAARLTLFAMLEPKVEGPLNVTAPNPATQREIARLVARLAGRKTVLPVPGPVLKLALGEFSRALLDDQRAVPKKALDAGFSFSCPSLEAAARSWAAGSGAGHD
jgi:uncharacterized protein